MTTGEIRVVQWATGGVGKAAIEGVLSHPDLELVGCWVHSADKHGKDVGEILGTGPVGVAATSSAEEILALDADCVVYSPLVPNDDEVAALLRSGKSVVTPVGWIYPDPAKVVAIEAACARGPVDAARHGHPPGRDHRAVPADGLGGERPGHPRAGRGVLRHPDLRRSGRDPARDGLRRYAGGGAGQPDGGAARRRLPRLGADGGGGDGLRRRPAHRDPPGGRRRDRADRLADRRHRARAGRRRGGSTGGRWSTAYRS